MRKQLVVGAILCAISALSIGACSTSTTLDASVIDPPSAKSQAAPSCTSNYHAGTESIDLVVQNNTGQMLTLASDWTRIAEGDWNQQAPDTIPAGGCAVINGYTDNPFADFWLTATYQLPDGTYVPFSCADENKETNASICNADAFTTMTTDSPNYMSDDNTPSAAWQINVSAVKGTEHQHWTLTAEPQS